jgi:hypothetical protein
MDTVRLIIVEGGGGGGLASPMRGPRHAVVLKLLAAL